MAGEDPQGRSGEGGQYINISGLLLTKIVSHHPALHTPRNIERVLSTSVGVGYILMVGNGELMGGRGGGGGGG